VLERHAPHGGAVVAVAHQSDEARQRADRGIAAREGLRFGAGVEILALNRNLQLSLR
jgi:hypothetical protein